MGTQADPRPARNYRAAHAILILLLIELYDTTETDHTPADGNSEFAPQPRPTSPVGLGWTPPLASHETLTNSHTDEANMSSFTFTGELHPSGWQIAQAQDVPPEIAAARKAHLQTYSLSNAPVAGSPAHRQLLPGHGRFQAAMAARRQHYNLTSISGRKQQPTAVTLRGFTASWDPVEGYECPEKLMDAVQLAVPGLPDTAIKIYHKHLRFIGQNATMGTWDVKVKAAATCHHHTPASKAKQTWQRQSQTPYLPPDHQHPGRGHIQTVHIPTLEGCCGRSHTHTHTPPAVTPPAPQLRAPPTVLEEVWYQSTTQGGALTSMLVTHQASSNSPPQLGPWSSQTPQTHGSRNPWCASTSLT